MVSPNSPALNQTVIDNFLSGNYQTTDSTNPYLVPVTPYTPPADPTIPDCGALYPNENRIYDPLSSSCVIVPEEEMNVDDNRGNIEGKNIENGLIEGYEQAFPAGLGPESGGLNSRKMMELESNLTPELASKIGLLNREYNYRGVQFDPTTGRYIAMSPTPSQFAGDVKRGFADVGSMFGNMGTDIFNSAKGYLANGGMLGMLANMFSPKQLPNRSQGGSTTNVGLLNNLSASSGGADRAEPAQDGNSFPSSYGGVYQNTPSAKKDRTPTPTPKKVQINAPAFKGMGYRRGR